MTNLDEGEIVEFELKTDGRGKSEAVNARQVKPTASHRGWVRNFTGQWGFLNSDDFDGDLFVGLRSNPHMSGLAQGDQVEFEIQIIDGKREAVNVQVKSDNLNGSTISSSNTSRQQSSSNGREPLRSQAKASEGRAQVGHLVGQRLVGKVRKFRDQWGFVTSTSFAGDLFIHARSNPELGPVIAGDPVEFEVAEDTQSDGNYQAVEATILKEALADLVGQRMTGWVKSFRDKWGLLNSRRFDGDCFIGLGSNPQLIANLSPGDGVEFEVARDSAKNGFQAINVQVTGQTVILPVAPATLLTERGTASSSARQPRPTVTDGVKPQLEELLGHCVRGTVRSFRDSWGFVVSDDFEGDLFLHQRSNPGVQLQSGDTVEFVISQERSGKLHATSVKVVPVDLEELIGKLCSGTVRSFSGDWGFVTSTRFVGDLFVGNRSNPQLAAIPPLKPGDQLEFTVQNSSRKSGSKSFEAVNVRVAGSVVVPVISSSSIPVSAPQQARYPRAPERSTGSRRSDHERYSSRSRSRRRYSRDRKPSRRR